MEPAFPLSHTDALGRGQEVYTGMTLRDYFAAQAMKGIQSRYDHFADQTAMWAYQIADAMMKEREKV